MHLRQACVQQNQKGCILLMFEEDASRVQSFVPLILSLVSGKGAVLQRLKRSWTSPNAGIRPIISRFTLFLLKDNPCHMMVIDESSHIQVPPIPVSHPQKDQIYYIFVHYADKLLRHHQIIRILLPLFIKSIYVSLLYGHALCTQVIAIAEYDLEDAVGLPQEAEIGVTYPHHTIEAESEGICVGKGMGTIGSIALHIRLDQIITGEDPSHVHQSGGISGNTVERTGLVALIRNKVPSRHVQSNGTTGLSLKQPANGNFIYSKVV